MANLTPRTVPRQRMKSLLHCQDQRRGAVPLLLVWCCHFGGDGGSFLFREHCEERAGKRCAVPAAKVEETTKTQNDHCIDKAEDASRFWIIPARIQTRKTPVWFKSNGDIVRNNRRNDWQKGWTTQSMHFSSTGQIFEGTLATWYPLARWLKSDMDTNRRSFSQGNYGKINIWSMVVSWVMGGTPKTLDGLWKGNSYL